MDDLERLQTELARRQLADYKKEHRSNILKGIGNTMKYSGQTLLSKFKPTGTRTMSEQNKMLFGKYDHIMGNEHTKRITDTSYLKNIAGTKRRIK